jgi:hypothetical protein
VLCAVEAVIILNLVAIGQHEFYPFDHRFHICESRSGVALCCLMKQAVEYARRALSIQRRQSVPKIAEPFAAVIFCTADAEKVDYRMRSKWSRVLRYAALYKDLDEPLRDFIKRKGGINKCATRYTRRLGRYSGQIP